MILRINIRCQAPVTTHLTQEMTAKPGAHEAESMQDAKRVGLQLENHLNGMSAVQGTKHTVVFREVLRIPETFHMLFTVYTLLGHETFNC